MLKSSWLLVLSSRHILRNSFAKLNNQIFCKYFLAFNIIRLGLSSPHHQFYHCCSATYRPIMLKSSWLLVLSSRHILRNSFAKLNNQIFCKYFLAFNIIRLGLSSPHHQFYHCCSATYRPIMLKSSWLLVLSSRHILRNSFAKLNNQIFCKYFLAFNIIRLGLSSPHHQFYHCCSATYRPIMLKSSWLLVSSSRHILRNYFTKLNNQIFCKYFLAFNIIRLGLSSPHHQFYHCCSATYRPIMLKSSWLLVLSSRHILRNSFAKLNNQIFCKYFLAFNIIRLGLSSPHHQFYHCCSATYRPIMLKSSWLLVLSSRHILRNSFAKLNNQIFCKYLLAFNIIRLGLSSPHHQFYHCCSATYRPIMLKSSWLLVLSSRHILRNSFAKLNNQGAAATFFLRCLKHF